MALTGTAGAADLSPYLPACVLTWLARAPEERWRTVDGSVVFADVTGFTPLTERLAKRGKVGAEELTDVLNDVFGALLEVASGHDGDLLKFGGDALLLLFAGPGHVRRACAAADGMLAALRPWSRVRTAGGTVRLAMSAGVASGPCDLYLVGSSHRELLPVGTVFGEAVRMEALAPSGRVAVAPAVARQLEGEVLGEAVEDGRLLRSRPAAAASTAPRAVGRPELASTGVPVGLREHLRQRREWGEHRLATLTFLQFRGTEALLADAGQEVVGRALDALVCSVQDACERYGATFLATDVDRDGGKVLLVAGAPTTTGADEDATLRAVRAVLDRPSLLSLRAGVNVGRAFAVDVGSPTRRTFAVMGDPTNLAARVMGRGSTGQLVATQDVLDRVHGSYALTALEPFLVKGKSQPVRAQLVGQPLSGQRAHDAGARLVGRDRERSLLEEALAELGAGRSCVLEVVGPTGSGKSRLLEEVRALAPHVPRLLVEPGPYDTRTPYRATAPPVLRLLGVRPDAPDETVAARLAHLARAVAPDLLPLLPLIGQPLGLELPETPESRAVDPAYRRARAHDACAALLSAGVDGPLLVLVDDAQWLDDASADLLRAVLDRVERDPRLVVVTRRDDLAGPSLPEDPGAPFRHLDLAPLAAADARVLIADVAGDAPLAAHVRDAVVARGAGNPLFLRELVASALRGGDLEALPDSVEAMITSSVDVIPAADRTQLRTAAVLGPRFPAPLLSAMLARSEGRQDPDGTEADEAVRRLPGFLARDGDEVRFLHGLVREVAYEGLPFRLRRQLHGAAADLLAESGGDDDVLDLLALHYSRAGRHAEAWTWTRRAAERARRLGAPVEAAAHLRSALEAARALRPEASEVARVQVQLGETCELLGRFEEAAQALREARRASRDPVALAALECREGRLRNASGRYAPALRWYTSGLRRLEARPPDQEVRRVRGVLSVAYAGTRCDQGRWQLALPHLDAAVEDASAAQDLSTLAQAHYLLDWARSELGDESAVQHLHEARRLYAELDDPVGLAKASNNLGATAYFAGRWDEAVEHYQEHGRQSARAGDLVRTAVSAHNVAEVRSDQGRLEEAEPLFREALQTWRAADYRLGVALARSNLARLLVRSGSAGAAAELLEQARTGFVEMGADAYVLEAEAREAERRVAAREPAEALEAVARTWSRCSERGGGGVAALLALLARLRGLAVAQTGDLAAASELLDQAVTRSSDAGTPYELALAQLDLARVLRARGRAATALEDSASQVLASLGVVAVPALPL